ncbi:MAG: ribbon-helix-helix domain-containing protein [Acidocella sp.]|nr:ribbon-helix-helix domain-containing protein [Acidocella sp.]
MKSACINLEESTLAALDDLARRTGRTRSNTVRHILETALARTKPPAPPHDLRDVWPD